MLLFRYLHIFHCVVIAHAARFLQTSSDDNRDIREHVHICGTPTDFSRSGCTAITKVGERVDAPKGPRYSLVSCFSFCKRQGVGGSQYFGLEKGGQVCWCGSFYYGEDLEAHRCSVNCDGSDEPCGGEDENIASVFIAFDCTPPTEEERGKERQRERERVDAMFLRKNNFSCITDDNALNVQGEPALVGSQHDCMVTCNLKLTCHGFTYEKEAQRCIFHDDALSGPVANNDRVCFWRKIDAGEEK